MSCCAFSRRRRVADRQLDLLDVVVAGQPALQRPERDDDRVVPVLAEVALALRLQQADDRARQRPQPEPAADRIGRPEQLVPRRLADDADGGAGAELALGEPAAARQLPVAGLEVGVGRAGHGRRAVLRAADDAEADGRHRRHGRHRRARRARARRRPAAERLGAARRAAGPDALARHDGQQVAAHAGDVRRDLRRGAVAERDHDDHRRDADDDAERRQRRAQHVAADLAKREDDGVEQHQWTPPVRSSLSTWPSRKRIVRDA